jgi:hypothetical protein
MNVWAGKKSAVLGARFDNPKSGTRIGRGLDLYHDAANAEFACVVGADGSIVLTVYQFDGGYTSLVHSLPRSQLARCRSGRVLRLRFDAFSTRPLTVFFRLNAATSEATQTRHEMVVIRDGERMIEFELEGLGLDLQALQSVWMDVIFSEPQMAEIMVKNFNLEVVGR